MGTLRELATRNLSSQAAAARLAIVATSIDDLRAKLAKARTALESKQTTLNDLQGIYLALARPECRAKIAFLFPGQGSQKTGMLGDLALYFPEFRDSLETAEKVLAGRFPKKLSAFIYPPPAFGPERERQQNLELTDTVVAQPALGVVEMGLCRALHRMGIRPDMTAGHSYGEYVALAAAGVFPEPVLYELSESRGRAIKDTTTGAAGTMAAVQADAEAVAHALGGMEGVTLANHNSPRQTVISGAKEAIQQAVARLEGAGLAARPIPVACAFHSPLMEPARGRFAEVLARQTFSKPAVAVFSNTLGARYPEDSREIADLLASHLVRPVKFVDEIRAMYEEGARVFVEIGPKGVLTGLARQILEGKEARFLQMDVADRHGIVQLLHALAQLAVEGAPLNVAQLLRGRLRESPPVASQPQWMVNGLKAFPRTQPPKEIKPMELCKPSALPPHLVAQVPDLPATPVQQSPAVHPVYAALTPITATDSPFAALSGVSLSVTLSARDGVAGRTSAATGGFLFTHHGYSGPSVLDVSHVMVRSRGERAVDESLASARLTVQWTTLDAVAWAVALRPQGNRTVTGALRAALPDRLAGVLLALANVEADRSLAELRRDERVGLIEFLVAGALPWTGDEGYRKAEVTGGGVSLAEVDARTMESRRQPFETSLFDLAHSGLKGRG